MVSTRRRIIAAVWTWFAHYPACRPPQATPARRSGEAAVVLAGFRFALIVVLGLFASAGFAQDQPNPAVTPAPPPSAGAKRSPTDLQKLVEPIALHPDPLIAVMLPAAAYPLEIVQAARFVKDTNNIPKVDEQPWDENVKAVAKFPELVAKMDQDLTWTIQLGQAFVDQPKELMDAIQELRGKAQKLGNLKTTEQQIVTVTNIIVLQTNVTEVTTVTQEVIEIAPASPTVIYVPSYPPTIYYPWYPYYVYPAPYVSFTVGFFWGAAWASHWHNHCNWSYGHVDIDIDTDRNIDRNRNTDRGQVSDRMKNNARASDRMNNAGNRAGASDRQAWKPDQNRMRQSGAGARNREARGWGSGNRAWTSNLGSRSASGNFGARPSTGNLGSRPSGGNVGTRPSTGTRPSSGNGGARPSTSQARSSYGNRASSSSAFNRSSAPSARASSYRGYSSRGGGGFGGGGRGGGRR